MEYALSLALLFIFTVVQQAQDGDSFHHTGSRVTQKLAAGFESAVDANVVLRSHEKVARLRRVVRGLFRYIVTARAIGIIPIASKCLSKNRVQGFFHSSVEVLTI